jgi:alpha-acetolactate decarboxylase
MKKIIISVIVLFSIAFLVHAQEGLTPFNIHHYGSSKKIVQTGMLGGVIGLEHALDGPHTYAVGEIKNAEGEITVYDGEVWLNYGKNGITTSISQIPKGEEAMQLVSAEVEKWQEIVIPKNMSERELYDFILERAAKLGLNTKSIFPFLIEGEMKDLVWHVLNGADFSKTPGGLQLFFVKLVEYTERTSATLVGFCSTDMRNEISSPGQLWHVHVLLNNEKITGHIDAFSVLKGSKLRLPIK